MSGVESAGDRMCDHSPTWLKGDSSTAIPG